MRRLLPAAGFVAGLALVFFASVRLLPEASDDPQGTIRILSRLDDYTRQSNPSIANTIPTFLTQVGTLGALTPEASAGPDDAAADPTAQPIITTDDVRPVNEVELQKGFCTATVARLVRQQYPGSYDTIPDAELEKTVIEKRPEYRDRVCVLPVWIDADPHDIIKYDVEAPGALAIGWTKFLWAGLITAVFAVAGIVAYRRLM